MTGTSEEKGVRVPGKSARRFLLPAALLLLLLLVTAGVYAWDTLRDSCEVEAVEEASTFLTTQENFFDRVYQVATTASRTSLERPVLTLKQIYLDTGQVSVPACMQTAQEELVSFMGAVIGAFQAYGAEEADSKVRGLLEQANVHYQNFHNEVEAVRECAPLCIR